MDKVITIPFNGSTVTILSRWINGEGYLRSYNDERLLDRAFFDRYDMKEFKDKAAFLNCIERLQTKAITVKPYE